MKKEDEKDCPKCGTKMFYLKVDEWRFPFMKTYSHIWECRNCNHKEGATEAVKK